MSDVFVVTWSPDCIELRQVTSKGLWQPHTPPIRTYELNRPTRPSRLFNPDSGGGFHLALADIFYDVEINHPVWLLLPHTWLQAFHVENPHLSSLEMQNAHLVWEAQQRLSGDILNYRVLIPEDLSTPKITVNIVRDDVIDTYAKAAEKADLEIAGVGCEPEWDTEYDFEALRDLRDTIPADLLYTEDRSFGSHDVSPILFISIAVITLLFAVFIWLIPVQDTSTPVPVGFSEKIKIAERDSLAELITETEDIKEPEIETTKQKQSWFKRLFGSDDKSEKESDAEVEAASAAAVVEDTLSPIHQAVNILPTGAVIQLAIITPLECRLEISGLTNPDAWTKKFRQTTSFSKVSQLGKYEFKGKSSVVIRFPLMDFKPVKTSINIEDWKNITVNSGMKVRGRSASGGQSEALRLIESVWENPGGIEKVYLMSSSGHWTVTVQ